MSYNLFLSEGKGSTVNKSAHLEIRCKEFNTPLMLPSGLRAKTSEPTGRET